MGHGHHLLLLCDRHYLRPYYAAWNALHSGIRGHNEVSRGRNCTYSFDVGYRYLRVRCSCGCKLASGVRFRPR